MNQISNSSDVNADTLPGEVYTQIKKEFSRAVRGNTPLTVCFVKMSDRNKSLQLVAFSDYEIRKKIESFFRESDSVYILNEKAFLFTGYSTGEDGVEKLKIKIGNAVTTLLGTISSISIGVAVYPDHAETVQELLSMAMDMDFEFDESQNGSSHFRIADKQVLNTIRLMFDKSRGLSLKRLLTMDLSDIWAGVQVLPQANQEAFLNRLPYNYDHIHELSALISSKKKLKEDICRVYDKIDSSYFEKQLVERYRNQENLLSKLDTTDSLPVLPIVARRIITIISDPDSTVDSLTAVIETDSSLTLKLLKIVNSAFYGCHQKIGTVKEAVVIMGFQEVLNLAMGLAAAKKLKNSNLTGCINTETLWHHSIGIAVIAQYLSNSLFKDKAPSVFTAGLLHDFGKIFLIEHFSEQYRQAHMDALKFSMPIYEVEEELWNINHAKIGEAISIKWNLPRDLILMIARHHQVLKASIGQDYSVIIGLADYLYHRIKPGDVSTDVASSLVARLTYGHYIRLNTMFNGRFTETIEELEASTRNVLSENSELLTLL